MVGLVVALQDEISANQEHIEHFHKKSVEIQEMLQSQEAPLELQVSPLIHSTVSKLQVGEHDKHLPSHLPSHNVAFR